MTTSTLFSSFELKRGDSDKQKIWGGRERPNTGNYVTALQESLLATNIPLTIDGEFGPGTERALKMFQWCLNSHPYRLSSQAVVIDTRKVVQIMNGRLDK